MIRIRISVNLVRLHADKLWNGIFSKVFKEKRNCIKESSYSEEILQESVYIYVNINIDF